MSKNNYSLSASLYAKHSLTGTPYLVFKYIPQIIKKFAKGKKTLDYGCGSGRSSRFLRDLDLDVEGVDVSQDMITEAINIDPAISYKLIKSASLPYDNETFNIVFSSLVLFDIPTKNEILAVFKEIYRVLEKEGIFIAVTGSSEMYNHSWKSLDANFPENNDLTSGSLAKILLKEIDLVLYDYFWTDQDYKEIIAKSDFTLIKQLYPLGDASDNIAWISETKVSPYVIYVLRK